MLTAGLVARKDLASLAVNDNLSLSQGQGLVYSNLSYGGMSGAPVLDRKGRVVGINTAAENAIEINQQDDVVEINLGASLGVPIGTLVSLLPQTKIQPEWLRVEKVKPAVITGSEVSDIQNQLFNFQVPAKDADSFDWFNYGVQLWRFDRFSYASSLLYNISDKFQQVDREAAALAAFERAIEIKPNFYQAYLAKAGILNYSRKNNQQKYQEALLALNKAVEINPNYYSGWISRGNVLGELKKYPEALQSIERAIKINPQDASGYIKRGYILNNMERYRDAIASLSQAIELDPQPYPYLLRSSYYMVSKEYSQALADINKVMALQVEPTNEAYLVRGLIYFLSQEPLKGLADIKRYRATEGDFSIFDLVLRTGSVSEKDKKDFEQGIQLLLSMSNLLNGYDRAIETQPNSAAEAYAARGIFYFLFSGSEDKQASNDFQKAIKIKPNLCDSYNESSPAWKELQNWFNLAASSDKNSTATFSVGAGFYSYCSLYNANLQNYQKAIAYSTQAIAIDSKFTLAYTYRGLYYLGLKEYQKAIADFKKVIELNPKSPEAYLILGGIYNSQGDYDAALREYNKAVALDEKSFVALNKIGFIRYEKGDIEAAKEYWEKAIKVNDKQAEPQLALAVAIYTQGDKVKGLQLAETALKIDKKFGNVKHLKENLSWGEKMIADTQLLLQHPQIEQFLDNGIKN